MEQRRAPKACVGSNGGVPLFASGSVLVPPWIQSLLPVWASPACSGGRRVLAGAVA